MNYSNFIGIDVAKSKVDITTSINSKYTYLGAFKNNYSGLTEFKSKLANIKLEDTLVILESTSIYHRLYADLLAKDGFNIYIVNPITAIGCFMTFGAHPCPV